jgi:hypothetical protein
LDNNTLFTKTTDEENISNSIEILINYLSQKIAFHLKNIQQTDISNPFIAADNVHKQISQT